VKSMKDIQQASILIEVLAARRPLELAKAWQTAWDTGPRWRGKLESGRARLDDVHEEILAKVLEKATTSRRRQSGKVVGQ
jgi:hypothetical protein